MNRVAISSACGALGLMGLIVIAVAADGATRKTVKPAGTPAHVRSLVHSSTVFVQPRSTVAQPEIVDAYQELDAAMDQQNVEKVLALYAPKAVFFDVRGQGHPLSYFAPLIRQSIKASQSIACRTAIQSALVQPDGTTITVSQRLNETEINPKTMILLTNVLSFTARDHWIQVNGQWKINRTRLLSSSSTTNAQK